MLHCEYCSLCTRTSLHFSSTLSCPHLLLCCFLTISNNGPDFVAVPVQDHHAGGLHGGQVLPPEALHWGLVPGVHQPDGGCRLLRSLPGGGAGSSCQAPVLGHSWTGEVQVGVNSCCGILEQGFCLLLTNITEVPGVHANTSQIKYYSFHTRTIHQLWLCVTLLRSGYIVCRDAPCLMFKVVKGRSVKKAFFMLSIFRNEKKTWSNVFHSVSKFIISVLQLNEL